MQNSEIVLALMECAFEGDLPDDAPTLRECMRLYNKLKREEDQTATDLSRALTESIRRQLGGPQLQPFAIAKVTEETPGTESGKEPEEPDTVEKTAEPETAEEPDTHTHTHTSEQATVSAVPPAKMPDAQKDPIAGSEPVFLGKGAAEKREISERLQRFRKEHGLGCLVTLANATNGVLTDNQIRMMMGGEKFPLASWKVLAAAIDYIEKRKKENENT